jgi:hypothetical protein
VAYRRELGVYAGSTSLPFGVFGRHRSRAESEEPCGFARPCATCRDTRSTLVMILRESRARLLLLKGLLRKRLQRPFFGDAGLCAELPATVAGISSARVDPRDDDAG